VLREGNGEMPGMILGRARRSLWTVVLLFCGVKHFAKRFTTRTIGNLRSTTANRTHVAWINTLAIGVRIGLASLTPGEPAIRRQD
jgi:hypothetical protein